MQQLMHAETASGIHLKERFLDQTRQAGKGCIRHLLGSVTIKPASKNRQSGEDQALVVRQECPGLVKDRPHATVAFLDIARGGRQKVEITLYFLRNMRDT